MIGLLIIWALCGVIEFVLDELWWISLGAPSTGGGYFITSFIFHLLLGPIVFLAGCYYRKVNS